VDLARVLGVNKDTVRNWETGRSAPRFAALGHKAVALVKQVAGGAVVREG
jgi:DNA-binding transcriptional regulator YiaG